MKNITSSILLFLFILIPCYGVKVEKPKCIQNPSSRLVLVNKMHYLKDTYEPSDLEPVNALSTHTIFLRKECRIAYEEWMNDCIKNEYSFYLFSGYRSYSYQKSIYMNSAYQAKPGFSEHQTGLAVDISLLEVGLITELEDYEAYQYVLKTSSLYGFILRYPKNKEEKTGYAYEPWHFRYVGKKEAKYIYEHQWILEEYIEKKTKI